MSGRESIYCKKICDILLFLLTTLSASNVENVKAMDLFTGFKNNYLEY